MENTGVQTDELAGLSVELGEGEEVILQDADIEQMDIVEVNQQIDDGFKDLEALESNRQMLLVAQESADIGKKLRAISSARALSERLRKHYGSVRITAVEDAGNKSGTVIALEEEINSTDGFFVRILKRILEMAKWFWRKLSEIFSMDGDPVKQSEKLSDAVRNIEKSVNNGAVIDTKEIDTFGVGKAFGFIGSHLAMQDLKSCLERIIPYNDQLVTITEHALHAYDDLITAMDRKNASNVDLVKALKDIQKHIESAFDRMARGSEADFISLGKHPEHGPLGSSKPRYYKLGPFAYNKILAISVIQLANGAYTYSSVFGRVKGNEVATLDDISVEGLLNIEAVHHKLSKISSITTEKLERNCRKAIDKERQLTNAVEKMSKSTEDGRFETARLIGSVWDSISNILQHSVYAKSAINETADEVYKTLRIIDRQLTKKK